ncbi:ATP-binding protein [Bacillus sp. Gen3]|uniref:ATP-binding protein n=1 Tax=Heyndrickxia oleronia TaxID=38875 RepID=UPI0015D44D3B|nr:ATP-binding protein [Heyndrickxia oleronia]MBU5212806.1 ATP-binding protein [Heyndrickxia oleronia]NYV63979.1 ATP-binding protein [Bacillus sp. Gen3]
MRDVLIVPFNDTENIVISTDNSGAIGLKAEDVVKVPYETVAYFSFRVAVMECMAAGAIPFSVVIHNFCQEESWEAMKLGIEKGIEELGLNEISMIGSTESNFQLTQSALGVTILGKMNKSEMKEVPIQPTTKFALIGMPLVGSEVIEQKDQVAPLSLFKWMCSQEEVTHILPVGSKGVLYKLKKLNSSLDRISKESTIDLLKSSGPATCFLIAYQRKSENKLIKKAGTLFHHL